MCIAAIAWQSHPEYPLIVVSNRDEFYTRGARPAAWWGQSVSVLAGRDEDAGGTWLGINRDGRVALITNVRAPTEKNPHAPSRGALVLAALQAGGADIGTWLQTLAPNTAAHNGFNLLVADPLPIRRSSVSGARSAGLHYFSNRLAAPPRTLAPGLYGLSNAFLDTPWPKVVRTVSAFATSIARRLDVKDLLALLADRTPAHDSSLPQTGVPPDWERVLSSVQIRANGYGTRASTVITVRRDGLVRFIERSFDTEDPDQHQDRTFEFMVSTATADGSDR